MGDETATRGGAPRARALLMRTWDEGESAIVRSLLAGYGIPCQCLSEVPHALLPMSVDVLGEIRILVPASLLERARTLLAEHRRQGLRIIPGGRRPARRSERNAAGGQGGG